MKQAISVLCLYATVISVQAMENQPAKAYQQFTDRFALVNQGMQAERRDIDGNALAELEKAQREARMITLTHYQDSSAGVFGQLVLHNVALQRKKEALECNYITY